MRQAINMMHTIKQLENKISVDGFFCAGFDGFGALPGQHTCLPYICSTCHCSQKTKNACTWRDWKPRKLGCKTPVKILAYLCCAFLHICVIFPGWVADSSCPDAVSTPPTVDALQKFAALENTNKTMQSGPECLFKTLL